MASSRGWILTAMTLAAALAPLAGAHAREYLETEWRGAVLVLLEFSSSCIDEQFQVPVVGVGGGVGAVLKTVAAAADPLAPDLNGSCWRRNHVLPNANGDVTFTVTDQLQTNVGACVSQDADRNGVGCPQINDPQVRFCNSVTVNVNLNPTTGLPQANYWKFQDSQGTPSLVTMLVVNRLSRSSAVVGGVIGGTFDCGVGVDNYGTVGLVSHM